MNVYPSSTVVSPLSVVPVGDTIVPVGGAIEGVPVSWPSGPSVG